MSGSSVKASSRARIMQDSRIDGSLPCTLQLTNTLGAAEILAALLSGVG